MYSLNIILTDSTSITAQDEFETEEEAVQQCQIFAINGYYSRATRTYWPPLRINCIKVVSKDYTNKC